jgi:serine/threonine protein kinase
MLQAEQVLHVREATPEESRYQLQQQLSNNAGRQTWLAADIGTSPTELVIVKLLAFSPQMQWDEFKLFEREAQVLKQLNHPRIPQYRDYFSIDKEAGAGLCWFGLVQQYIPGASIKQFLEQGKRFAEAEVKKLATDVLEILTYLHGLNPPVLHRDIKPSNLILGDDGQVYLVDFGAVQDSAAAEGVTFTVVGTTGYAPLEQFWGRAVPASDLYALGATLIHLLTGTAPADLPQRDLRIQFRDRISLSPNFTRWIEVLTAPDLEKRFTQASEALEAFHTNRYPKTSIPNIPKPTGSIVQIKKTPNKLSIKIPQKKTKQFLLELIKLSGNLILTVWSIPVLLAVLFLMAGLVAGLFALLISSFQNAMILAIPFLSLPLIGFIFFLRWLWIASNEELRHIQNDFSLEKLNLLGHQCLDFNQQYFVIERQLLSLSYHSQMEELSAIKDFKQIPFKELTIETKVFSYSFGQELTELERSWLFQEIKDWLNSRS